jgi:predicted GNAT family acetyltransferase
VPSELRGRGAAQMLAKVALDFISSQNAKVYPSCSFIRDKYLPGNPTYSHLIIDQSSL